MFSIVLLTLISLPTIHSNETSFNFYESGGQKIRNSFIFSKTAFTIFAVLAAIVVIIVLCIGFRSVLLALYANFYKKETPPIIIAVPSPIVNASDEELVKESNDKQYKSQISGQQNQNNEKLTKESSNCVKEDTKKTNDQIINQNKNV